MDDRDKPKDGFPLSGEMSESDDDVTARSSVLPLQMQRALTSLAKQHNLNAAELRKLVAKTEESLREAIDEIKASHAEHVTTDEQRHVDLTGLPGGGPGRVGLIERWIATWSARFWGVLIAAALGAGGAFAAVYRVGGAIESSVKDDARRDERLDELTENQKLILAALWRAGLMTPAPLPVPPTGGTQ